MSHITNTTLHSDSFLRTIQQSIHLRVNRSNTMSVTQSVTNLVAVRIATNSAIVTCRHNPVVGIHQHTTNKRPVTSASCRNIQCQIHKIFIPRFSHIDLSSSLKNFFTFNIIIKAKKEKLKSDENTPKKATQCGLEK